MPTLVLVMILAAAAFSYWSSARAAAERAEVLGREACRTAGVQWLDQTVHATGLRLRRQDSGRLGWERSFRFDYSLDGLDRHVGRMVMRGDRLVSFSGPVSQSPARLN